MSYPSTVTALTNPNPTDRLNSPSHATIEQNQNTEITAIETFVGTLSSTIGTLVYDVRAAASGGGGHVQVANLGGTGQTQFSKGDILVAQSSSVLSKLNIGTDGQILAADSTQQVGVKWKDNPSPKIWTNGISSTVHGEAGEVSVLSASILGSTLGTSNAVIATTYIDDFNPRSSTIVRAVYGNGAVASVVLNGDNVTYTGYMRNTIIAAGSSTSQMNIFEIKLQSPAAVNVSTNSVISMTLYNTSSVISDASQRFGITLRESTAGDGATIKGFIIEKVV